jgi:hypothetical protein
LKSITPSTTHAATLAAGISLAFPSPAFSGGEWTMGLTRSGSRTSFAQTITVVHRVETNLYIAVALRFKVETGDARYPEDRWYAWINERWVLIPQEKIVQDYAPDGQPYLFMWSDSIQCFVRPKGGL